MAKPMADLDREEFWAEWWRRWVKGTVQSFVAWGDEPLSAVAKKVRTIVQRGDIRPYEVVKLLDDVEEQSIEKMGSMNILLGDRRDRMVAIRRELAGRR